jgi:unsaturated rhamnogalacturonyl hydrolase
MKHQHHIGQLFLSAIGMLVGLLCIFSCQAKTIEEVHFIVQRNYNPRPASEETQIVLEWGELSSRLKGVKGVSITELNFGKQISVQYIDSDKDGKPNQIVLNFIFNSNEPIFSFVATKTSAPRTLSATSIAMDSRLSVTFLMSSGEYLEKNKITNWPDKIISSTMQFYPDPYDLPLYAPRKWNYEYGFFLNGMFAQWQATHNQKYLDYVKKWVDHFVTDTGELNPTQYKPQDYKLDDILPGRLLISLYQETKNEKYKKAATQLELQLQTQPRTKEGGYWHKQIYPYQMWLDGIFMADVFSAQYSKAFDKPELLNEAILQIKLISKHTIDPVTGLLYHGWDESLNKVWAHPEKGTSPEFWARAIGWYAMALSECLDYIPENHPDRKTIIDLFQKVSASVIKYQDKKLNLWYQVIDKGNQTGNWIETSGSAMFAYAFAKGYRQGFLDASYYQAAQRAFNSLLSDNVFFDAEGKLYLDQTVKIGTLNPKGSKGDYEYYITTERRINDYKGLAALLNASQALQSYQENH